MVNYGLVELLNATTGSEERHSIKEEKTEITQKGRVDIRREKTQNEQRMIKEAKHTKQSFFRCFQKRRKRSGSIYCISYSKREKC